MLLVVIGLNRISCCNCRAIQYIPYEHTVCEYYVDLLFKVPLLWIFENDLSCSV